MSLPLAVVLVSGGLDSCVTAALAAPDHELAFLHLNYRQRTERRELRAFAEIAAHYNVDRRMVVDVSYMQQIGTSSLIDRNIPVPEGETALEEGTPSTYVPFRNANILGIGVAWAEATGARDVFIGAHEEETIYPDCRGEFFAAYNRMIATCARSQVPVRVRTPLLAFDKAAIIRRGVELSAPLHLTWSCYQNEEEACGRCHSCMLRRRGFRSAGVEDPASYAGQAEEPPGPEE